MDPLVQDYDINDNPRQNTWYDGGYEIVNDVIKKVRSIEICWGCELRTAKLYPVQQSVFLFQQCPTLRTTNFCGGGDEMSHKKWRLDE
jgi:hypothetical protein